MPRDYSVVVWAEKSAVLKDASLGISAGFPSFHLDPQTSIPRDFKDWVEPGSVANKITPDEQRKMSDKDKLPSDLIRKTESSSSFNDMINYNTVDDNGVPFMLNHLIEATSANTFHHNVILFDSRTY